MNYFEDKYINYLGDKYINYFGDKYKNNFRDKYDRKNEKKSSSIYVEIRSIVTQPNCQNNLLINPSFPDYSYCSYNHQAHVPKLFNLN